VLGRIFTSSCRAVSEPREITLAIRRITQSSAFFWHFRIKKLSTVRKLVRSARAISRELSKPKGRGPASPTEDRCLKLGIALGGGFARGLVHIGVLKALEDARITVDFVAGTSVGALIGACYCAGVSAEELKEIARATRFKDFARRTLSRYGLCSNDRMQHYCARILKVTTFEDLKIPLAIAATDFHTGAPAVFTQGPLVGPIRASCAYPGMFLPDEIEGRSYVDGMLGYAVPTTPLREMGADRVLGVYLSAHWMAERPPRHLFEVIGQCFSDRAGQHVRAMEEGCRPGARARR